MLTLYRNRRRLVVTSRLERDVLHSLRVVATRTGSSVSTVVAEAVAQYLEKRAVTDHGR